ncbi:hypothetical protein EV361DRAFT_930974 [Lentinula raphanica]|nr:hypothetical protein EV361DRAFT_930974 [Lentinula raphanica]
MLNLPIELHHYLQNRDAFQSVLESLNLVYRYDNLPLDTKVVDLLESLHSSLVQCGWSFPENHEASTFFNRHERLAIQLLRFSGKGNTNNNAKTARLIPGKVESADMTLRDVVFNTNDYGIAKYVITNTKKFILQTIIRSPNVSLVLNLAEKSLGSNSTTSRHFCLSKRIYGIFRSDTNAYVDEGYTALDEDKIELGCRRDDQTEDEEVRVVARMLRDPSEDNQIGASYSRNNPQSGPSSRNSPLSSTDVLTEDPIPEEVDILWETDWRPARQLHEDYTFFFSNRSKVFKIVDEHLRNVIDTEPLGFSIKGENPQALLSEYTVLVQRAINEEDFSALLSENRHFQLVANDIYISSGPGIEKEVMDLFFKEKLDGHVHDFLVRVIDNYTTLSTVPISSAADLSLAKKKELKLFGAAVGLALVHGHYPANINPLLLVYLLSSCNLKSLSKYLVMESFPDLYCTLSQWNSLDYDDDNLSYFQPHFATYHNLLVPALQGRSERHHRSLAWTMLHNAIIGPVTTDHPYFKAFVEGLLLPCKPMDINLSQIAASCFGGTSEFVLSLLDTRINGDYDALPLEYTDRTSPATRTALRDACEAIPNWAEFEFSKIFREFLEGTGLPYPSLMAELQGRFDDVVTLEGASQKGYRMHMFFWAATGSPQIPSDGVAIEVILVDDNDATYFSLQDHRADERARLLEHGTIAFKTCTRMMQVPASYLLKLLGASHDSGPAPSDHVEDSIFHWLLVQILSAIGTYNVV